MAGATGVKLLDAFIRLLVDDSTVERDAAKAGSKAGDAAAKNMGEQLQSGLSKAIGKGLKLGIAGILGAETKQVADLQRAMADFRAETGATAEEARAAGKAINELSGDNLQPIEEIGKAMAKIRTDLGVIDPTKLKELTDRFLKFARVTDQDAAEAVLGFDDALDNWGLTVDDADQLMDKLLVSHQKYGGIVADNTKTLAALAPALKAANFGIDDGIALLGLFGAKGLNAEVAAAAFAKALTKVRSPAQLKAMIADIAGTGDAFVRGQKAADLFGARAGAKLANALGGVDLEGYKIGVEESAGALEKAAEASLTDVDRLRLAVKRFTSALADLGLQDLSPVFLGLSTLATLGGGKILSGLAKGVVASGPVLKRAFYTVLAGGLELAAKTGMSIGNATGDGIVTGVKSKGAALLRTIGTLALGALIVIPVVLDVVREERDKELVELDHWTQETIARLKRGLLTEADKQQVEDVFKLKVGNFLESDDQKKQFAAIQQTWRAAIADLRTTGKGFEDVFALPGEEAEDAIKKTASELPGATAKVWTEAGEKLQGEVTQAAAKMYQGVPFAVEHAADVAADAASKFSRVPANIADAIRSKRSLVTDAMDLLTAAIKGSKMPEDAGLIGDLVSKKLVHSLKSSEPLVNAQAKASKQVWLERLGELVGENGKLGKKAMAALNKAIDDKDPEIARTARKLKKTIENGVLPNQKTTSDKTTDAVVGAINDSTTEVGRAANELGLVIAQEIARGIQGKLSLAPAPTHPKGTPGHKGSGGAAPSTVPTGALVTPGPDHQVTIGARAGGGRARKDEPIVVGEKRPEVFVPDVAGTIIPAVPDAAPAHAPWAPPASPARPPDVAGALEAMFASYRNMTAGPRASDRSPAPAGFPDTAELERTPRGPDLDSGRQLYVPELASAPSHARGFGGGLEPPEPSAGDEHFHLQVIGDIRARDTGEALHQMQRLRSSARRRFTHAGGGPAPRPTVKSSHG